MSDFRGGHGNVGSNPDSASGYNSSSKGSSSSSSSKNGSGGNSILTSASFSSSGNASSSISCSSISSYDSGNATTSAASTSFDRLSSHELIMTYDPRGCIYGPEGHLTPDAVWKQHLEFLAYIPE